MGVNSFLVIKGNAKSHSRKTDCGIDLQIHGAKQSVFTYCLYMYAHGHLGTGNMKKFETYFRPLASK